MALPIVNQEHHSTMIAHGIIHTTAGAIDQKRSPSLHERNQNSSMMLNPHHCLGPCHADSLCLATTDRSYSTQEHLVPLYPVYHHMWSALLILVPASTGSLVQTRPETGALSSEPNWCTASSQVLSCLKTSHYSAILASVPRNLLQLHVDQV